MSIVRKLVLLAVMAVAATAFIVPSAFAASASIHDQRSVEPELHHPSPELEVRNEANNAHCAAVTPVASTNPAPHVTTGGCVVHVSGAAIRLIAHLSPAMEVQVSSCNWEFDIRINRTGEGWITHQELTDGGGVGSCTRTACPELPEPAPPAEAKAWGFYLRERGLVAPTETITFLFCLVGSSDPHGAQTFCELEIPFTETEAGVATNHRYNLNLNPNDPVTGGIPCHHTVATEVPRAEFIGSFNTEMVAGTTQENVTENRLEINHT